LNDYQSYHMKKLANANPFSVSRMHYEPITPCIPPLHLFSQVRKKSRTFAHFWMTVAFFLADTVIFRASNAF
jgi:hypothetical protein